MENHVCSHCGCGIVEDDEEPDSTDVREQEEYIAEQEWLQEQMYGPFLEDPMQWER